MTTMQTANRLVELCNAGDFANAIDELYADDAVHFEAAEMPGMPKVLRGKDAIRKASEEWDTMNEVHSFHTSAPYPHGDTFICTMQAEITPKAGPMAGQRIAMDEACHYTLNADGKIAEVRFFYDMPGG